MKLLVRCGVNIISTGVIHLGEFLSFTLLCINLKLIKIASGLFFTLLAEKIYGLHRVHLKNKNQIKLSCVNVQNS